MIRVHFFLLVFICLLVLLLLLLLLFSGTCEALLDIVMKLGSISAALSCLVYPPREEGGRNAGSFPEQRLEIEPMMKSALYK